MTAHPPPPSEPSANEAPARAPLPSTPPPPVPPPGAGSAEHVAAAPPAPGGPSWPDGPAWIDDAPPRTAPPIPERRFDGRERELDHRIVTVWRVFSALGWSVPVIAAVVVAFAVVGVYGWAVALLAMAFLLLVVWWLPRARYRRWRWQLTDLALELRSGVLIHRYESVPYFRIQQIDIAQGPVDRMVHLATLQVTTASASGSAALPGLHESDAPAIRAELLARAALALADQPSEIRDAV